MVGVYGKSPCAFEENQLYPVNTAGTPHSNERGTGSINRGRKSTFAAGTAGRSARLCMRRSGNSPGLLRPKVQWCNDLPRKRKKLHLNYGSDGEVHVVRNDRMLSKNNPSAQLEYNIPEMLREIISSHFYEPDYRNVTQKLLYEDISYDYAIEHGIALVAKSDVFLYKKRT